MKCLCIHEDVCNFKNNIETAMKGVIEIGYGGRSQSEINLSTFIMENCKHRLFANDGMNLEKEKFELHEFEVNISHKEAYAHLLMNRSVKRANWNYWIMTKEAWIIYHFTASDKEAKDWISRRME